MAGMLGHLFREQEAREERQRMRRDYGVTYEDDGFGSFDDGDPFTTNLYVGNLAPTVDEEVCTPCLEPTLPSVSISIAGTACINQSHRRSAQTRLDEDSYTSKLYAKTVRLFVEQRLHCLID